MKVRFIDFLSLIEDNLLKVSNKIKGNKITYNNIKEKQTPWNRRKQTNGKDPKINNSMV